MADNDPMPSFRTQSVIATGGILLALLTGCRPSAWQPAASVATTGAGPAPYAFVEERIRTTSPDIAMGNLEAEMAQLERRAAHHALTSVEGAGLVELLAAHGQYTGRIADHERALAIAEALALASPDDPVALLARARARSAFHRFTESLADVDRAAARGASASAVANLRAAIYQAVGRFDEALVIRRANAERNPSSDNLGALASVQAQRGAVDAAAQLFAEARWSYRDTSPFPLAYLYFDEGAMWMRHGYLERARALLEAALHRVPSFAMARCHLAEVESALGHTEQAIALLEPLAQTADDPQAAAQLVGLLTAAGRSDEAAPWRQVAAGRYDELVAAYPDAYAPHAAEFWLNAGGDLQERLLLARYAPAPRRLARTSW